MKNFPAALAIQLPAPSTESHSCDQCLVSFQRYFIDILSNMLLPWWLSGREYACQCRRYRRCRFNPWVRKIPWSRKWQPTPVFLPGICLDRGAWWAIVHRVTESWTQLSDWAYTLSMFIVPSFTQMVTYHTYALWLFFQLKVLKIFSL